MQLNQFFVNSFAYYGLTMNIGDLAADNVYLNFAVSGGFQEKTKIVSWLKKKLIKYRTSRNPKLWLGRSHLALRRAQNSIFRVCVDNFDDNWHIGENCETTEWRLYWINFPGQCSSVESHCSQFPWCRKANPPLSLSLRSLVRSGLPIVIWEYFQLVCLILGKMCITFSFGVIFLYGAELFPTEIRTSGIGSASFVGRSLFIIILPWKSRFFFNDPSLVTLFVHHLYQFCSPPLSRSSPQLLRISLPRFGGMFAPWVEQAGRAYQMPQLTVTGPDECH